MPLQRVQINEYIVRLKSLTMTNFIFKSSKGLIKNVDLELKLTVMQTQLRHLRDDNRTIMNMIQKLLIDKHLQMQVDEYFEDNKEEKAPEGDLG